jgi:hypothetical protein
MLPPKMMTDMARRIAAIAALLAIGACKQGAATVGPGDTSCGSCASVFANGGIPCGDTASSDAYDDLLTCACDTCSTECSDTLCSMEPPSSACGKCLEAKCVDEQATCGDN